MLSGAGPKNPISDIAAAAFWTASPWHIATSIIVATYAQLTGCTHPSGTFLIHDNDDEAHSERLYFDMIMILSTGNDDFFWSGDRAPPKY